jgi:hypothetical protein
MSTTRIPPSKPSVRTVHIELDLLVNPKAEPLTSSTDWWASHAATLISLNSDYCNAVVSRTDSVALQRRCEALEALVSTIRESLAKAKEI